MGKQPQLTVPAGAGVLTKSNPTTFVFSYALYNKFDAMQNSAAFDAIIPHFTS